MMDATFNDWPGMKTLRSFPLFMALGFAATASSTEVPSFAAERLSVPRVDTETQVGQYQEAVLLRLPSGDFRLEGVELLEAGKVYQLPGIQAVEVRQVGTRPAAVFLRISGEDISCDHVSPLRFHQRLKGNRFEVVVSSRHYLPKPSVSYGCIAVLRPIRLTVPLEVYGLAAGTYAFTVNGRNAGEFQLAQDNCYEDDHHQTMVRGCPRQQVPTESAGSRRGGGRD